MAKIISHKTASNRNSGKPSNRLASISPNRKSDTIAFCYGNTCLGQTTIGLVSSYKRFIRILSKATRYKSIARKLKLGSNGKVINQK